MLDVHEQENHKPSIVFFIDNKRFHTSETALSVRTILTNYAEENPEQVSLALKSGKELHRFTNLDEVIHLHPDMHFVVLHESPTQVS